MAGNCLKQQIKYFLSIQYQPDWRTLVLGLTSYMTKIAFHTNVLNERGTVVAICDYAYYNEKLLGNKSVILYNRGYEGNGASAIERIKKSFEVYSYSSKSEIEDILRNLQIDVLYAIKSGENDGFLSNYCKTVVHAVFRQFQPHGDVYAYVSEWLSYKMTKGAYPFVPHIVTLPETQESLRERLGISKDAIVFGRYGAWETFQYKPTLRVLPSIAKKRKDIVFLFMNTAPFCPPMDNIIHLPMELDPMEKAKFINTCDAMLHARKQGESFGLAVGEFSIKNKPIITNYFCKDRAHIHMLGDKGIYYWNGLHLKLILNRFKPDTSKNWDAFSERFNPSQVMQKFNEVFLKNG